MNLNIPLNATSFGQAAYNIFLELVNAGQEISLVPIGGIDVSCHELNQDANNTILECLSRGNNEFKRQKSLKLWHINGLRDAVGSPAYAMTFHETDRLTPFEASVISSLDGVFVTSKYTKEVFEQSCSCPIHYCPLGFDSKAFKRIELPEDETIVFGLRGKLEKRKHTLKILEAWVKRFGNDPRYRLDCSIFNPFYSNDEQSKMILSAFPNNQKPFNINVLPYYKENLLYNKALNAVDIDLTGMSGCEGFNLPLFQSLCLGKRAVVLNAHVHKDYCNEENSILVEPNGMIGAEDGKFFVKGNGINQGYWFDFDEDDFIAACEVAIESAKVNNEAGELLAKGFPYLRTAEIILSTMK